MTRILIATANSDKIREIGEIWSDFTKLEISWLADYPEIILPEETGNTLKENALLKASEVSALLNVPVVAVDTGLFVDFLSGRPGIHSARYAGENASYEDNVKKLLSELKGVKLKDRTARFITVVSLVRPGFDPLYAEGMVEGRILENPSGSGGFGYDPIFIPDESNKSFAEMDLNEKNQISHRRRAFEKMGEIIKNQSFL